MKETVWLRLFRGVRRLRQRPDWPQWVGADWADRIMGLAVTDRFHAKQGRSIARWVVQNQNGHLVVYLKRHYRLSRWKGLLATVWPDAGWSPAVQEWHHLQWAKASGMPVPMALAAGEYIGPWGQLQSFLAVEELTDMLPLHEAVPVAAAHLDAKTFRAWKRTLGAEVARLTRDCTHAAIFTRTCTCATFISHANGRRRSLIGRARSISSISTGCSVTDSPGASGR